MTPRDQSAEFSQSVAVERLLGRRPNANYTIAVVDVRGEPQVIRNAPFMHDGTPMPTLYWLVDRDLTAAIGTLEADGGVRRAEAEVDPAQLQRAHDRYEQERNQHIPPEASLRPAGGVAGTRRGVKCLHAHYAYLLAGGDDPVGRWVQSHLVGSVL